MSDDTNDNMPPDDRPVDAHDNAPKSEPAPPREAEIEARMDVLDPAQELFEIVLLDEKALDYTEVRSLPLKAIVDVGLRQAFKAAREVHSKGRGVSLGALYKELHPHNDSVTLDALMAMTGKAVAAHPSAAPMFARQLAESYRATMARQAIANLAGETDMSAAELAHALRQQTESLERDVSRYGARRPLRSPLTLTREWLGKDLGPMPMLLRYVPRPVKTSGGGSVQPDQGGYLPSGIVGMLAAPGGTGKTRALMQLAIAVATGTPWLTVFKPERPGRVLMVLGEEDRDTIQRRMYAYTQNAKQLHAKGHDVELDLDLIEKNLKLIPGRGAAMRLLDERGEETPEYHELRTTLTGPDEWALVILDPAARFLPPEAEKDNAVATRFIEALERLAMKGTGKPTVLIAHHMNKGALGKDASVGNQGLARGSSALTDGVRWQANMLWSKADADAKRRPVLSHAKQNYGPFAPDLELKHDDGALRFERVIDTKATEPANEDRPTQKAHFSNRRRKSG